MKMWLSGSEIKAGRLYRLPRQAACISKKLERTYSPLQRADLSAFQAADRLGIIHTSAVPLLFVNSHYIYNLTCQKVGK
jgi:hypothetical protein